MRKVLLVEDDKDLAMTLSDNLHLEGYYVNWLTDGKKAEQSFQKDHYDIVLLDLMLPNASGYEVLSSIRAKSDVPVIILSAKSQVEDRLKGLKLKADDYLTKPFHLNELFLRMQNILSRSQLMKPKHTGFVIGEYEVDLLRMRLQSRNHEEKINLSESECKALNLFYQKQNQYISREDLIGYIWGLSSTANTRTIDNLVLKFRKIFEKEPTKPIYFVSKRGFGYCLKTSEDEL